MCAKADNVVIRQATAADIESLTTIVPRAYAPDAFLPKIIPDTPAIRQWWAKTFENAITDPAAKLLVAVHENETIGVFTMHYWGPESPYSTSRGVTSAIPLTPDHSPALAEAFVELGEERTMYMGSEPHYLVELVGVDDRYQSLGVGRRLTQKACEIADERDAAIFLQTSAARDYYVKKTNLDFETMKEGNEHGSGGTITRPRKSKRHTAPN